MRQIYDSFSDLCLVDLMSIDHLNLKFLVIVDIHDSVIFFILDLNFKGSGFRKF